MYQIIAQARSIKGEIILPFSKSESNRSLIIQHLADKEFKINNLSDADDTRILQQLLSSDETTLDCGDGGTTFRFLLAYLALKGEEKILTGSKRLCERPIKPLVDALNQLGAKITYEERENFPPLKIAKGDFTNASSISIAADISSQFISALLLIAPKLPNGLIIKLEGKIVSKSYIEMTLSMMQWFGIKYLFNQNYISVKPQNYICKDFTVNADWSAASYFYEMAVLAQEAEILLLGLSKNSLQGDELTDELMQLYGIESTEKNRGIRIRKNNLIKPPSQFEYDFTDCPDLAQTFAFMNAAIGSQCILNGLDNLPLKETNRIAALKAELEKLGCVIEATNNKITFFQINEELKIDSNFKSYNDHRMIMALTPIALIFSPIYLDSTNDVTKSFPFFWRELNKLGITKNEIIQVIGHK